MLERLPSLLSLIGHVPAICEWVRTHLKKRPPPPTRQSLKTEHDIARFSVHDMERLLYGQKGWLHRKERQNRIRSCLFRAAQGKQQLHRVVCKHGPQWEWGLLNVHRKGAFVDWSVDMEPGREPFLKAKLAYERRVSVEVPTTLNKQHVTVEVFKSDDFSQAVFKVDAFGMLRPLLSTPADPEHIASLPGTHLENWKPASVELCTIITTRTPENKWEFDTRSRAGFKLPQRNQDFLFGSDTDLRREMGNKCRTKAWDRAVAELNDFAEPDFESAKNRMIHILVQFCNILQCALSEKLIEKRKETIPRLVEVHHRKKEMHMT